MKTSSNNNNIESKNNQVFNAIVDAIKSDRMIGRHIAESYGLNGPRPVYGIEVWESIVYVHTDTDRRIFDKAIDRLLKAHTDLFKWADFQKVAEDGPHIVLALTEQAVEWKKIVETPESLREYISKIKAEAMARVPYKKGDRIKDNQGQEGTVLDVSPNIWWNNYGVPYIMSQLGMVTNPKHFDPNDPNDQPDVDARVELDNGKIWAGGYHLYHPVATLEESCEITAPSEQGINVGTEVWTTIELHEEYGKRGKVVRKFFAEHGVWCLDIEFEDGTKATYAEEYVTTEKPWAVVGAKCRHKYLDSDVVLTITAVGQYYGIKAESEDGKVKRCDLVSYFEPVEEITEAEGVKVGDRVWCKHGEVMGTVTAIRIWNPDYAFKVRLDKPVTLFGQTFEETEFRRAGITKNYDRDGMIVGNAQYYAEQLKYGPASIIEYELAGVALRTESTREDVEPDSREGWGNEYRVTIHHQTGDTTETMTLSETAELLARMYQEEQGEAA